MRWLLCLALVAVCVSVLSEEAGPPTDPEQLPQYIEALLGGKKFGEALTVCEDLLRSNPDASRIILEQVVRVHEAAGRPGEAAAALRKLVGDEATTVENIEQLSRVASLYAAGDKLQEAIKAYEEILARYPEALSDYQARANLTQYARNRKALDQGILAGKIGAAIVGAYELAGDERAAVAARLRTLRAYPDIPGTRQVCLGIARSYSAIHHWPGALNSCLRLLDYGGDRCYPFDAKLAENQVYLDAISTPNDESTLLEVFGVISEAATGLEAADPVGEEQLARLASLWAAAERAAYAVRWSEDWEAGTKGEGRWRSATRSVLRTDKGDEQNDLVRPKWERVVAECRGTVFEPLSHLSLGGWLHYRGFYPEARRHYLAALATEQRMPGIASWVAFGLGELNAQMGDFATAREHFGKCHLAWEKPLAAEAALRAAECLEFQGLVSEAMAENQALAARKDYPHSIRERAAYALKRISESRDALPYLRDRKQDSSVKYLGQDRQSQGDWRFSGRDLYVLCAAQGWFDICGGLLGQTKYRADTTQPDHRVYWWRWSGDPDASMLYDPVGNDQGPRNWDDRGEQMPPGTGPDLVVTLPVPQGTFRLALYFVNDHNYYEPNRMHTIYVSDAASGALLTAAPLRDFATGVCTRFLVSGPRVLRIHVWRNMSINTLLTGIFLDDLASMPTWAQLRAGPLSDDNIPPDVADYAGMPERWDEYRRIWAEGGGRLAETAALRRFLVALRNPVSPYWSGRATEALAEHLRDLGYIGQSCVLEDEALAIVSEQSPRRYADALLRAAEAYGQSVEYAAVDNVHDFRPSGAPRRGALYETYALAQLAKYVTMVGAPRSLVVSEDVLALARKYTTSSQFSMAQLCFEAMAPDGDIQKLQPADTYQYSRCVADKERKIGILRGLLAREEPLPRPKSHIYQSLVFLQIALRRLGDAEADMETLVTLEAAPDTKRDSAKALAMAFWRSEKQAASAKKWSEYLLNEFPDSTAARMAEKLLRDIEKAQKSIP